VFRLLRSLWHIQRPRTLLLRLSEKGLEGFSIAHLWCPREKVLPYENAVPLILSLLGLPVLFTVTSRVILARSGGDALRFFHQRVRGRLLHRR
jgi:hypothetical protein